MKCVAPYKGQGPIKLIVYLSSLSNNTNNDDVEAHGSLLSSLAEAAAGCSMLISLSIKMIILKIEQEQYIF